MQKIPTIFERDWNGDRSRVVDIPHPDCGWVFAGEGHPTRKLDGMCAMVRDGKLYKRREVKKGKQAPPDFEIVMADDETGKTVGWVPVGDGPEDKFFREAMSDDLPDGTYELVGPKSQGGVEGYAEHTLVSHGDLSIDEDIPRTFDGLREWLTGQDIEGLVFHHDDGRMGKIKGRDFGLSRR